LDLFADYCSEVGKHMVDAGVDLVIYADDLCDRHGPMIQPALFRKYVFPGMRKQIRAVQKRGLTASLHCCGNTYAILGDLVNYVGINGYHAIEPMAGMDIGSVKEKYGDRICLFGNVDVSHTLPFGTTADVIKETKEVIKKAASGGGLFVASSNSLHYGVDIKNFITMTKTAHKFGEYFI